MNSRSVSLICAVAAPSNRDFCKTLPGEISEAITQGHMFNARSGWIGHETVAYELRCQPPPKLLGASG